MTSLPLPGASARRDRALLWSIAGSLGVLYLLFAPRTGDLATQIHRTNVFGLRSFAIWDNFWFGGHHLPGYSVLFPTLAALLSPTVVGACALVGSTLVFARLLERAGYRSRIAAIWFAVGMAANLVSGRLTFALGVFVGMLAVWALVERRPFAAVLCTALTALASPVAVVFVALVGAASIATRRRDGRLVRTALAVVASAGVAVVALQLFFPEGGDFPFVWWAFTETVVITLVCYFVVPAKERVFRAGLLLYAAGCVVAFFVPSAMGANAMRLGTLVLGPLLVATTRVRGRYFVMLLALALVVWQWENPVYDYVLAHNNPTVDEAYYKPLLHELDVRGTDEAFRLEIPPTDSHWESVYVAERFPIARGWERQLDRKLNGLFYEDTALTGASYGRWLRSTGVRYVAVPHMPAGDFDLAGQAEVRLIRTGLPYLSLEWQGRHWSLYSVRDASLVDGPGVVTSFGVDTVTLRVDQSEVPLTVKVRWSPYFEVLKGQACLAESRDGWTRVTALRSGTVEIAARVGAGHRPAECA